MTVTSYWHHFQQLDYEQLPFKCRHCHEHDHFQRNCPKFQQGDETEGWQRPKKGKTAPKNQERRTGSGLQDPSSKKATEEGTFPPNSSQIHTPNQPSATEGTSAAIILPDSLNVADPSGPGEVPTHPDPTLSPVITEIIPPLNAQEEDPSNLDSDQEGFSEEEYSYSSSPQATPLKSNRGRKSKKKHREEKSLRDVAKGSQKTLPNMISTRSRQGQPTKGATPPKKV